MQHYSLDRLRERYPEFLYRDYSVHIGETSIAFEAHFEVGRDIRFRPCITIPYRDAEWIATLDRGVVDNLAFHLGLMEIPSYWKATCSPRIVIEAGRLDEFQVGWWRDLIINGMGEFFFTNDIDFTAADFVTIESSARTPNTRLHEADLDRERLLVGIGGGKDSAVSAELLKGEGIRGASWMLNPTQAAIDVARVSGLGEQIVLSRRIDERLLELNRQGYLNGHTPFSAYIAFAAAATCVLNDCGRVVVSNERSSNEGNAVFHGREINHQYSKTFAFEQKFRQYASSYLSKSVEYCSFLRPLYELQIAQIFATMPVYFSVFRSCNRGQKTNSWCQTCSKCLFVYACLFPFLDEEELAMVFSQDLFANPDLIETGFELTGVRPVKPLECVGCREESIAAFYLCREKLLRAGQPLPVVVEAVNSAVGLQTEAHRESARKLLSSWNEENALPADLANRLARAVGV